MMPNKKILLAGLVLVLVLIAWLFYPKNLHSKAAGFHRVLVARNFKKTKRIDTYSIIMSLTTYGQTLFMNRMLDVVSLNPEGGITNTFRIKDSRYLASNFLVGVEVDSSGLYLQDTQNRTFTKMAFNKTVLYQQKINTPLLRSVYLQNDAYLVKTMGIADNYANDFFEIYRPQDASASVMDTLIPHYGKGGLASDGLFVKNADGKIWYFYFFMSHVFSFDPSGKPLPGFNTIDGDNMPPPVIKTATGYTASPDRHVIHSAAYADQQHLYLCSDVRSVDISEKDFDNNYVIDVYDTGTGQYQNSFFLPKENRNHLSSLLVTDGKIYTVEKNRFLTIYN